MYAFRDIPTYQYFRLKSVTFNTFEYWSVCKREGRLESVCAEKERSVCDDPTLFLTKFLLILVYLAACDDECAKMIKI